MGKIIVSLLLVGFVSFAVVVYKIGKEETYQRPCGGGRHNA